MVAGRSAAAHTDADDVQSLSADTFFQGSADLEASLCAVRLKRRPEKRIRCIRARVCSVPLSSLSSATDITAANLPFRFFRLDIPEVFQPLKGW